jgi:nucleotide-binding universal stress UspA family protein
MSACISDLALRRIAYTSDSTIACSNGLAWAVQLAREYQAALLLLQPVPPPTPIFEIESAVKSEAELALALLLGKLETVNLKAQAFLLTGTGSVDGQIVRAARRAHVDLLIMGSSSRNWLDRWLSGNLASRVVSRAHCPVLVIPNHTREISGLPEFLRTSSKDEKLLC